MFLFGNPLEEAFKIGRAIADYRTRKQLQLWQYDPLRQAQAQLYRARATTAIPAEAEWLRARARAIPAEEMYNRARAMYEVPARARMYEAEARYGIPAEAYLRWMTAQAVPSTIEYTKARTRAIGWEDVDREWIGKAFEILSPLFSALYSLYGLNLP